MIKILKNPPPLEKKSTKGKGERLARLDPRTIELLAILPKLNEGDAFEIPGEVMKIVGLVGRAESRSAREAGRPRRAIKIVQKDPKTAIVYILASK